ncbi:MAG TPA: hypothetical protein VG965_01455 [Patescibacteria group bacterium]|nr:hypothetical protein [Patescibacteria group bacterium]
MTNQKILFNEQPCERCGSPKKVAKTWTEEIKTSLGEPIKIEVSQSICTNKVCQAEFDSNREKEIALINNRKVAKEEQDAKRKGKKSVNNE